MNIRELVNFIDLMELDLQGNRNMNINYQGRPVDNTPANLLQFPPGNVTGTRGGQAGTAPTAPSTASAAQATGPTGDPVLDQPIDQAAPKPKKTMAQRIGGVAKAVGAIPGAWQGAKTAYQKGKADMATRVGGPVNQPQAAGGTQQASGQQAAGGGGYDEVADLRQLVNRLDARVTALSARIPAQTAPAQAVGEHRRPRRLRVVR